MVKKFYAFLGLLILTACGAKSDPANSLNSQVNNAFIEQATVLTLTGSELQMGEVLTATSKSAVIRNPTSSEVTGLVPILTGEDADKFTITSAPCTSLKSRTNCTLRLSFDPKNREARTYTAALEVGGLIIPVSATAVAQVADLKLLEGSLEVGSTISFGTLSGSQQVSKVLTLKNLGTASTAQAPMVSLSGDAQIVSQNCSRILKSKDYCEIRVAMSASGKDNGNLVAQLKVDNKQVELTATVNTVLALGLAQGVDMRAFFSGVEFQTMALDVGAIKVITLKNVGTVKSAKLSASLSGVDGAQFSMLTNQCINIQLAPNATCDIKLAFDGRNKTPRNYLAALNIADKSFELTSILLPTCIGNTHAEGFTCVNNVQSCEVTNGQGQMTWDKISLSYGACQLLSCNAGFDKINNSCLAQCLTSEHRDAQNVCVSNQLDCAPEITNAQKATKNWNGSAYGTCQLESCQQGFDKLGNQCLAECATNEHRDAQNVCVSNSLDCVSEILNAQTANKEWNGSSFGACQLQNCQTGFDKLGNQCSPACLAAEHRDNAGQCVSNQLDCVPEINNSLVAIKTWDGTAYGQCQLDTCQAGFDKLNNQCLVECSVLEHRNPQTMLCESNILDCTPEIADALHATQTWGPNGYEACDLHACNASFHEESNACVSNEQECLVDNGTGSKMWNVALNAYDGCLAENCEINYHVENFLCKADIKDCLVEHGQGTMTWLPASLDYSACEAKSCDSNYHVENLLCQNDKATCPILNGAGSKYWNPALLSYGTCLAESCDANFKVENGVCVPEAKDCTSTIANAISASQPYENGVYGACEVHACEAGYTPNGQVCKNNSGVGQSGFFYDGGRSCMQYADGKIFCSGSNYGNMLGLGNDVSQVNVPTKIPLESTGKHIPYTMCFKEDDGKVMCLGYNKLIRQLQGLPEIFNNNYGTFSAPYEVAQLSAATKIYTGVSIICYRNASNQVYCTTSGGYNTLGLGNNVILPETMQRVAWLDAAVEIWPDYRRICGRMSNGDVHCAGENRYSEIHPQPTNIIGVPVIAVGYKNAKKMTFSTAGHSCALMDNNSVKCAGFTSFGQAGLTNGGGSQSAVNPAAITAFQDALDVQAQGFFTCARFSNGTVKCLGQNTQGQFGDGTTGNFYNSTAVTTLYTDVTALFVNQQATCVQTSQGDSYCSGVQNNGEFANGTKDVRPSSPQKTLF